MTNLALLKVEAQIYYLNFQPDCTYRVASHVTSHTHILLASSLKAFSIPQYYT